MNHDRYHADRLRAAMREYHRAATPIVDAAARHAMASTTRVLLTQDGRIEVSRDTPTEYVDALRALWRNCLRSHLLSHLIDGDEKT